MDPNHRRPDRAAAKPQPGDIGPFELERLERAFVRLPRAHAAVFWAVRRMGLSYAEVAWLTGRSREHVRILFADALYRLCSDVDEQKRGETVHPLRRFVRARLRDFRLALRLMRGRL